MKTLKNLGLSKHKTANYADYLDKKENPMICCGFMEIHEDSGNLGITETPIFKVEPIYWNNRVVFVYKPDSSWVIFSKTHFLNRKKVSGITFSGKAFCFDATKEHGLVPRSIAEKLNSEGFLESKKYLDFARFCGLSTSPKLVWKWKS